MDGRDCRGAIRSGSVTRISEERAPGSASLLFPTRTPEASDCQFFPFVPNFQRRHLTRNLSLQIYGSEVIGLIS
jgi:hypothetical protein